MKRKAIKDQGGNRFHSSLLRFNNAIPDFSQVNDLHLVSGFIDRLRHIFFGFNANRTTGMIEYCCAHLWIPFFVSGHSGSSRLMGQKYPFGPFPESGHFLVPRAQNGENRCYS
jgi:hypothetical protein